MTSPDARPPVQLRLATLHDIPELRRLECAAFPEVDWFPAYAFRRLLSRAPDHHPILVACLAEAPDILLGDSILYFRKGSRVVRMYNIVVDPACQGMGIGSLLMNAALDTARQRDGNRIYLEVRVSNAHAIAFYIRHGFSRVREIACYYPDGEAALKMERSV